MNYLVAVGILCSLFFVLEGVVTFFAGSHFNDILNIVDEDLAITEVTGVEDTLRSIDNLSYRNLADDHIDLDFWHQVGFDFDASVHFLMTLLHAITHNVGDGHAGDS